MFKIKKSRKFANGIVYLLETDDGYPLEVTDTFLPYYTKFCINKHSNKLNKNDPGSRTERWMIGVSVMSGCPVHCKFCATGKLKKWRNLTAEEIAAQVEFIISRNNYNPKNSKEFKINYTRMGEPFLNTENVKKAIRLVNKLHTNVHHYISTIGIKKSDMAWIKNNMTLQLSLHSTDEQRRKGLIPYTNKMSISELGQVRTKSALKTTLNLTLVDKKDFDIKILREYFDPEYFFIKLSPINKNSISEKHKLGKGIIKQTNLL
ncbi:MAG: radical SAM protein [Candidatus Margulisbacteria bacterium]|nr:radical SAM protein [Candidatus Margulisiibacteriota bacterium]